MKYYAWILLGQVSLYQPDPNPDPDPNPHLSLDPARSGQPVQARERAAVRAARWRAASVRVVGSAAAASRPPPAACCRVCCASRLPRGRAVALLGAARPLLTHSVGAKRAYVHSPNEHVIVVPLEKAVRPRLRAHPRTRVRHVYASMMRPHAACAARLAGTCRGVDMGRGGVARATPRVGPAPRMPSESSNCS